MQKTSQKKNSGRINDASKWKWHRNILPNEASVRPILMEPGYISHMQPIERVAKLWRTISAWHKNSTNVDVNEKIDRSTGELTSLFEIIWPNNGQIRTTWDTSDCPGGMTIPTQHVNGDPTARCIGAPVAYMSVEHEFGKIKWAKKFSNRNRFAFSCRSTNNRSTTLLQQNTIKITLTTAGIRHTPSITLLRKARKII